jgi:hypothetical protein
LFDVFFIDEFNGWAIGGTNNFQIIIYTTNGGTNWNVRSNQTGNWLYSVYFVDALNGWISGENGTILHTTNGGNTWLNKNSGVNLMLESIFFTDYNNGWISGESGLILHTTDGGNTWNNQDSNTNRNLYNIFFADSYHGWAVGDFGVITRTSLAFSVSVPVSIVDGWNILSVPLLAPDMTATTLFPTAVSPFYFYNNGYNQVNILQNGKGYWAKFDGNQSTTITGTYVGSNETSVNQGWNLVGPFAFNVPVNGITTIPSNIIVSPFYGYEGGYISADTLKPGKGYWVKTNASGIMQMNVILRK